MRTMFRLRKEKGTRDKKKKQSKNTTQCYKLINK